MRRVLLACLCGLLLLEGAACRRHGNGGPPAEVVPVTPPPPPPPPLPLPPPGDASIYLTGWTNSRTGDTDLVFAAMPGETITFSAETNVPAGEWLWYVNRMPQGASGSSFAWTVPNVTGTWNILLEARAPNPPAVGVDLGKFAFLVWTVTTSAIVNVAPGGDIQAAVDSLPADGGIVELAGGSWTLATEQKVAIAGVPLANDYPNNGLVSSSPPLQIATQKAAIKVENRRNVTIRGQGRSGANETFLQQGPGLIGDVIKVYNSPNASVQDVRIEGGYGGVEFESTSDGLIHNIHVTGGERCGIIVMGHAGSPVHDILVVNCETSYAGSEGVIIGYDRDAYEVTIRNCYAHHAVMGVKLDSCRPHLFGGFNHVERNVIQDVGTTGVWIYSGSFNTIARNNTVTAASWHGIAVYSSSNCVIDRNVVRDTVGHPEGGAISIFDKGHFTSNTIVRNNLVFGNGSMGITVQNEYNEPYPENTTIVGNTFYGNASHGVRVLAPSANTVMRNNIVVQNGGFGITATAMGVSADHNDVWGNTAGDYAGVAAGPGALSADPLFADAMAGDFHLRSQAGRWNGAAWVVDAATSPAIDAGDPGSPFSNEPAPNGGRANMGAYGNTEEASRTP